MPCTEKVIENGQVVQRPCYSPSRATASASSVVTNGPGTELKKLLKNFGIEATPACSCNSKAKLMDLKEASEPGWCEKNIDTIVGWLRDEAAKRKLPFFNFMGKMLVQRAINNYKKNA